MSNMIMLLVSLAMKNPLPHVERSINGLSTQLTNRTKAIEGPCSGKTKVRLIDKCLTVVQ